MTATSYRYTFGPAVAIDEVEATVVLSRLATESLCGEAQTRLDADYGFEPELRVVVIDPSTDVGRAFNSVFVGLVSREFGSDSFRVERREGLALRTGPNPDPVSA